MHTYLSSVILFLSLFYAEKSQVDFKLTVLKQETDMNFTNNPRSNPESSAGVEKPSIHLSS